MANFSSVFELFFFVANWGRGKGGICSHSLALTHFKLKQKFWHLNRKLERAELWNMAKCLPAVFLETCWQLEKSSGSWKLIFLYALILRRLSRKAKHKTTWMSWQNFLIFTKANSLGSSWLVRHVGNRRVDYWRDVFKRRALNKLVRRTSPFAVAAAQS